MLVLESFGGLALRTAPGVYVPHEWFLPVAKEAVERTPAGGKVLDLGTGSGAVALYVASKRPDLDVWGVDVNPLAVRLAAENAASLGIDAGFRVSDLYSDWTEMVDVICCTLPYDRRAEVERLIAEDPDWEGTPPEAHIGGEETGYELVAEACAYGAHFLREEGLFIHYGDTHTAPGWRRMFDLCGYDLVSEKVTNEEGSMVFVGRKRAQT